MPLSQEYQYLYKYYCKKYGEREAHKVLADKPVKFLSRANDICKWKDSFDKGDFYELKKLDDTSIHTRYNRPKTKLADQSQAKLGSGFASGVSTVAIISFLFTVAWFVVCTLFNINYDFHYLVYIAPFLFGAAFLAGGLLEIYNFIARKCLNKRQNEFPYASLYIQHCSQNVKVKDILNIPIEDIELIDLYYYAVSHALQDKITTHKELMYSKLNEFCQSANYHNVVCKSNPSYYGRSKSYSKTLMPFSKIREHFDEPKGFEVLMALLNPSTNGTVPICIYDDGYFDSAFFNTKPQKKYKARNELFIVVAALIAVVLSFLFFKFPFVWHQQIPIVREQLFQKSMDKYNQKCSLIDLDYKKKLQQPVYLLGVSVNHELVYNGGIGNDWSTYAEVNGKGIGYSEITVPVIIGETLKLYSEIIEEDPSSDDVGSSHVNIPVKLEQINAGFSKTLTTTVRESHGHGAGQSARWESTFYIRKIEKLEHRPEGYNPPKEPYPSKPVKDLEHEVNSWELFKSTIANII